MSNFKVIIPLFYCPSYVSFSEIFHGLKLFCHGLFILEEGILGGREIFWSSGFSRLVRIFKIILYLKLEMLYFQK
jgi:hypothetical protein